MTSHSSHIHDHQIRTVLLAEDNLEHCFFFKRALNQINSKIQYSEVNDGEALMTLLESFIPDLLFLDLNMPCKNGVECINAIRANKIYDALPIVVFTISTQENAIQAAYGFGANLYFVKPKEYAHLINAIQKILTMDWSEPGRITRNYFRENKYQVFDADGE